MKRSERKPKKLWFKVPLAIVLIILVGVGVYVYSIYDNAKDTVNEKMHEPVKSIDHTLTAKKMKATKPLNILLLGVDARANDRGRSDALMVMSLDPENNKMQIVSIPRDTRTMIVGKGFNDKINHAYAYGGADMSVATVENFLDIELDYFVRMNMQGLDALVDQLGTITIDNKIAWQDGKYNFTKGPTTMDGDKTMHFVQMRKQDPAGDFGRTARQRQVIQGIVNKGASVASVSKINGVIDVLGNNMTTNLDFDDMKKLLSGYKGTRENVVSYMMKGNGTTIDGTYYLQVPDSEVEKVHGMIAEVKS
ncbi:LCP family glycopolymer transferase [Virgibacillus necropolis]|uniref:Transcriptional regulator LytR n=1 Tax=Virgibacillus necropolis TaxID=163877 RepID=A0A221M9B8_9BACI|nr:LCP family protein [Virgibacillus necropolis]ASN04235.1 transcriptional regulator LytR [Virgibacillus necropolis]